MATSKPNQNAVVFPVDNLPGEEWRDVVGYEGVYRVSNLGRVLALARKVPCRSGGLRPIPQSILACVSDRLGYKRLKPNGRKFMFVHRMVMRAFVGEPPEGKYSVNHKNGKPFDNRLANLEYCSHRENILHAVRLGLHNVSLPTDVRIKIARLHSQGFSVRQISRDIGVSCDSVLKYKNTPFVDE